MSGDEVTRAAEAAARVDEHLRAARRELDLASAALPAAVEAAYIAGRRDERARRLEALDAAPEPQRGHLRIVGGGQ